MADILARVSIMMKTQIAALSLNPILLDRPTIAASLSQYTLHFRPYWYVGRGFHLAGYVESCWLALMAE